MESPIYYITWLVTTKDFPLTESVVIVLLFVSLLPTYAFYLYYMDTLLLHTILCTFSFVNECVP